MNQNQKTPKKTYVAPKIEKLEFEDEDIVLTSETMTVAMAGGGCDEHRGRNHENPRTFSTGRYSGC